LFGIHGTDLHYRSASILESIPGIVFPKDWVLLRERYYAALAADVDDFAAVYCSAVASGAKADLGQLRANALAGIAASSAVQADLDNRLRSAVYPAAVAAWQPVSQANYQVVASLFDKGAQALTAALNLVPLDVDPASILKAEAPVREAFSDSIANAAALDELEPALVAAAELLGSTLPTVNYLIPLTVDTSHAHRRRIHLAWSDLTGRASRWGALVEAEGILRAHPDPTSIEPYETAPPPREEWTRVAHGHQRRVVDDADAEYEELRKQLVKK
jgi:hypothetical protein